MLNPLYCRGCGQRLEIPEGFAKAKLRCGECGVYTDLPPELREQLATGKPVSKPGPTAAAQTPQPEAEADEEPVAVDVVPAGGVVPGVRRGGPALDLRPGPGGEI